MENKSELFEPFLKELIGLLRKYNVDLMVRPHPVWAEDAELVAEFKIKGEDGCIELNLVEGVYDDDTPERFLIGD